MEKNKFIQTDFYLSAHERFKVLVGRIYAPTLTRNSYRNALRIREQFPNEPFRNLFLDAAAFEIIRHLRYLKEVRNSNCAENIPYGKDKYDPCSRNSDVYLRGKNKLNSLEKFILGELESGKDAKDIAIAHGVSIDLILLMMYHLDGTLRKLN